MALQAHARHLHRAVGRSWEVVEIQRSQFSDAEHIKLIINVAVGVHRLRRRSSTWADGKRPPSYKCQLGERLGVLPTGQDHWWDLHPAMDLAGLAATLLHGIEQHGLPWLELRFVDERFRDACLADLHAAPAQRTRSLERLVALIGPDDAVAAVAAEQRRRDAER